MMEVSPDLVYSALCWAAVVIPFCFSFLLEPKHCGMEGEDQLGWFLDSTGGPTVLWGDGDHGVRARPSAPTPAQRIKLSQIG
mmetsp:Transcript_50947/g.119802  ORF Transcript_50947/g.119802 Transcript_50947/m.119802 type:complete len:82 (-) Transcript_50947:249-494(-)